MKSKKTQLADLIVMLPRDTNLYHLNSSKSTDFCRKYLYFEKFILRRLGQKLSKSDSDILNYSKLAIEKGFIVFSEDIKDSIFYLPKGIVIYDAIHAFVNAQMRQEGFIKLGVPYFFQKKKKDIKALTDKFLGRLIGISTSNNNEKTYLRYASDPVLFAYLRNKKIECAPLKIYSPGDTFRDEKPGEIHRFRRPKVSFIEDYHIFTYNIKKMVRDMHNLNSRVMDTLCDEWFVSCDVEKKFFEKNKNYLRKIVDKHNRPFVFNVMNQMPNYYTLQFQYFYGISNGSFTNLADLQIDEVNGKRFNIKIKDKGYATIIHGNTNGRMHKVFIPLFDQAAKMQKKGNKPTLPLWLSPIQARLIPVKNFFIDYCISIAKQYYNYGLRIDIDDRNLKFNKKIQLAEQEWIPYIIVIGQNEIKSGDITLRTRNGILKTINVDKFIEDLVAALSNYPKIPQNLPTLVSKQINLSFL